MTELQLWANKRVKEYDAARQAAPKPVVLARPQSKSNPKVKYMLIQYPNGNIQCNCPGFVWRKRCCHTKDLGL